MFAIWRLPAILVCVMVQMVSAIDLDVESADSIKATAKLIAKDMISFYHGDEPGQIPGLLPFPPDGYYWWEAGAMFGSLVSYWFYTGDTTYNAITTQAMLFQVGENVDYAPRNQTASLGNDDQAFWAMTALAAAEYNFPNPPDPKGPSWLGLAQAVFNEQVGRWDTEFCNGGLRWQVIPQNRGYDLKNSISNGCLFNIAARLARYTKDPMYAEWAVKIWDWMWRIGLIDNNNYNVYDNSEAVMLNCSQLDTNRWSYNAGTMIMGASTMFNYTGGDPLWKNRTQGLLKSMGSFFPHGIMKEGCEDNPNPSLVCNTDQKSFKAYLSRWLAITSQMAPFTAPNITALLKTSAKAAADQCNGGADGTLCGIKWDQNGTWDGTTGVGQEMSALEVVLATMVGTTSPPLTGETGGTSVSQPTAGHNSSATTFITILPATNAGRVGAWLLTVFIVLAAIFGIFFMWSEAWEGGGSTLRGMAKKNSFQEKGKQRELDPERVIIDLNTGKRRSVGGLGSLKDGAGSGVLAKLEANDSASGLPSLVEEKVEDLKNVPIYRGGELVT